MPPSGTLESLFQSVYPIGELTHPQDVIALHAISSDDLSAYISWDVDQHQQDAPAAVKEANLKAAIALASYLAAMGIHAIVEDSNGNGGFHVVAILARPIPSPIAFAFARTAVSEAGLSEDTETFPAQASARNKYGNALRLFGRHHDGRPHWSRFLHRGRWLAGGEAVEYLLHAPVNDPAPILSRAEPTSSAIVRSNVPRPPALRASISEGGRNNELTSIAGFLHSRRMDRSALLRALNAINEQECDPPLSESEVERIVDSITNYRNDDKRPEAVFESVTLLMEAWNSQLAVVPIGGKAMIAVRESDSYEFYSPGQFKMLYMPVRVWVTSDGKRSLKCAADIWLASPLRRQFKKLVFAPGAPANDDVLNLFTGFAVEPREGDCSLFLNHVRDQICGGVEERFNWVMTFAAQIFQQPMRKVGAALVLRGKQGVGKTIFGRTLGVLLGRYYLLVAQARYVTGHFNRFLETCLVLQADEAFWVGDKEAEGVLKNLITSDTLLIERKGIDAYEMANFTRVLVSSNADWVIPAGLEERRFTVLDVSDTHMQDAAYFAAMEDQLRSGGYGALMSILLNWPVDENLLRRPLRTTALMEQKLASLSAEQAWLLDLLSRATLPGDLNGIGEAPGPLLYESYLRHAKNVGRPRRGIETIVGGFLHKAIPTISKRRGFYFLGSQQRACTMWLFPPLAEARALFERYLQSDDVFDADLSGKWENDGEADEL